MSQRVKNFSSSRGGTGSPFGTFSPQTSNSNNNNSLESDSPFGLRRDSYPPAIKRIGHYITSPLKDITFSDGSSLEMGSSRNSESMDFWKNRLGSKYAFN